ncbi:hypothetical protein CXB51_028113 [Gossypium anomalum]|uniref:Aminotransferase-like plant mobile domain-containing protein n=1 Tax=Gossypium anomalum TaxID=47600 RepID=A0A8J5XXM4_9ROSI|nr:hypothetical protein CXB51_028113 [Gossypium anomalum]
MANIGRGCKLDPKLISAFIERWRPGTHTFHLPCGECTIILEDVQLQLGLLVDGSVLTGSLLIEKPYATIFWVRFQIIFMEVGSRWAGYKTHSRSWGMIRLKVAGELSWGSAVLLTLYWKMCQVEPFGELWWNTYRSRRYTTSMSKAHFQWTPYEDLAIWVVILDEFLQNLNIWHVKVLLINYATVKMHEDPWQAIFALERAEALAIPCRKGMTGHFKSKDKG